MQIYTPENKLLLDTPVDDSSLRFKEVMGDNNLTLKFSLPEYLKAAGNDLGIPLGSWCEFKAERYMLFSPENFVKQHSEHYDYTLILEAWIAYMKFVKFKFFTVERNPGEPDKMVGAPKLKFSLTATPEDFVRLLVDCMNFSGVTGWIVGECIESDPVTIDFNHDYCYDVLQKIADAFSTEWEVDNKTIHIRKVERKDGNGNRISFPLSYGYDNGILPGITRQQFDDSKVINRVWTQGGDRNINFETYKNDTLLMPKNSVFEYEGKQYRTDESGCYVEEVNRKGSLSEDSLDTSKVYPKRVGSVTEVIEVDDSKGFYDFTDTSIPESLDFSKMIIPGEKMTVIFQTGQLAGKEFEVKYNHKTRKFELVPNTDNGLTYPQGSIIPEAGDKYAIFHMSLPQEYIDSAEIESRNEAVKFLYENSQPKYTYTWQLDGIYAKQEWGAIGGFLMPGYFVEFSDPQFLPEPVDIRITSVKEYVNKPKSPTIEISNNVTGKALGAVLNEIPTQEQGTDRKDSVIKEYAKRRWKDTQELIDGIMGMSDEFQENLLSALVFEGMVFRAGASTLQYRFLADDWDTSIEPDIYFNKTEKRFYCPASKIKHETIEINGQKPYWVIPEYRTDALPAATPYYLYLKCSKELAVVNGRLTGDAIFFISDQRIKIEDEEGFYTLWVAFINSENEEGDRSFTTMYGLAELLPGQLTVDTLRSSDGKSFWKALKNQFKIGSLDWNVTKKDTLTLDGFVNALGAILGGFTIDNEKIQSLAKTSLNLSYQKEELTTAMGYITKDGEYARGEDPSYLCSVLYLSIGQDDKYVIINSMGSDSPAKAITFYDKNKIKISASDNIGFGVEQKINKPQNATYFRITYHKNYPFVLDVFGDERVNIVLNGTDGSGSLAANGISWDSRGNQKIRGAFESNTSGDRIIIDPLAREIKLVSVTGEVAGKWSFDVYGNSNIDMGGTLFSTNGINNNRNEDTRHKFSISEDGISCIHFDENFNAVRRFSADLDHLTGYLYMQMVGLPDRSAGLPSGFLYRDGNTIKITT